MKQRVKIKKLKHQVNLLDKALNETIKRNEKYEDKLKCRIAAKNILLTELETSNTLLNQRLNHLQDNTEILCNSLQAKTIQMLDMQKEIDSLKKENVRKKSFFERIFV